MRFRLPAGYERLEPELRPLAAKVLVRGSVTASLTVKSQAQESGELAINRAALETVKAVADELARETGAAPASVDGMLAVRHLFEVREAGLSDEARKGLDDALRRGFADALAALVRARRAEGDKIAELLRGQMDTITGIVKAADALPARQPGAIAARLRDLVAQLVDAAPQLDEERLHQEAVLLAAKADIREELDRLNAHVAAADKLFADAGAVGRDLNFLAQEFNREANTLCSKSNDTELTRLGLKLKGVVDQFREQVQNIE